MIWRNELPHMRKCSKMFNKWDMEKNAVIQRKDTIINN